MTRMSFWAAAVGTAVAVLGTQAGCSSTGGGRGGCNGSSCRGQVAGYPPAPAVASTVAATAPPAKATASAPRYGGQKTCPVSGEELGSMGDPVPVSVGSQTIYVCCQGCAKRALADPAMTLSAVEADRAGR